MGMLDALTGSNQIPTKYDIITGISAGGLNAGFLSYYASREYYSCNTMSLC
jgi:predicted acylesterase/phospholipase RssA